MAAFTVTNSYEALSGTLTVTKCFTGEIRKGEVPEDLTIIVSGGEQSYTLKLNADPNAQEYAPTANSAFPTYTWILENLPEGVYTVTETAATAQITGYDLKTTYTGFPVPLTKSSGDEKTIGTPSAKPVEIFVAKGSSDARATVVNHYTKGFGTLKITKVFEGLPKEAKPSSLCFRITGPKGYDGPVSVTLADFRKNDKGEYVYTDAKVPVGQYNIEETAAVVDGYRLIGTAYDMRSASVLKTGDVAAFTVTNSYEALPGMITVTKCFTGEIKKGEVPEDLTIIVAGGEQSYTLKLNADPNAQEYAPTAGSAFPTYTWIIRNVPEGVYTVTETAATAQVTGHNLKTTYTGFPVPLTKSSGDEKTIGNPSAKPVAIFVAKGSRDARATVVNHYTKGFGMLKITKVFEGLPKEVEPSSLKFKITGPKGYNGPLCITLADFRKNDKGEYVYTDTKVPVGQYRIEETAAIVDGYRLTGTAYDVRSASIVDTGDVAAFTVTNTYEALPSTAVVVITKSFTGDISKDEVPANLTITVAGGEQSYTLKLNADPNAREYAPTADSKFPTYTWILENVPEGTYTVSESADSARVDGYNLATTYEEASTEPVIILVGKDGKTARATVTNEYTKPSGTLKITKVFEGLSEGVEPSSLSFKITGPKSYTGPADIILADFQKNDKGEYIYTDTKVPVGQYSIEETAAAVEGYRLTGTAYDMRSASVLKTGDVAAFTVTNSYEALPGVATITVTKSFKGISESKLPKNLTITVAGGEESYTLKLNADPNAQEYAPTADSAFPTYTWILENVPAGAYTVTEDKGSAKVSGYNLSVTGDGKTITLADGAEGAFELGNAYSDKKPSVGPSVVPEQLNGEDHYAYIIGYPDGLVKPNGNITRAEVATIFFRLLTEEVREANLISSNSFGDVEYGMWFNTAISTMARMGIVNGYPDGDFHPNANITRAEFAAIAARFDKVTSSEGTDFSDILGHWAQAEIQRAANRGWINGYPDGTFRPERLATRAEVATMINRVLIRDPEEPEDLLDNMVKWPDNMDTDAWYYMDVQEATNTHEYERVTKPTETWIKMLENPDWTRYNH